MKARRYALVEGHGEVDAIGNLLSRMSERLGDGVPWAKPLRWPNLHLWEVKGKGGVRAAVEFARRKDDVASLLLVRDADDACPREVAPRLAGDIRSLAAPFPTAYVLFRPEYEVLFLPCLESMAGKELDGRPGLELSAVWDGQHWEARRGVKEWLSRHFPKNRSYKPTVDQLLLTRLIDLDRLSSAGVPCFGTLERALVALVRSTPGDVYPAPRVSG